MKNFTFVLFLLISQGFAQTAYITDQQTSNVLVFDIKTQQMTSPPINGVNLRI